jgi:hypothetical protein
MRVLGTILALFSSCVGVSVIFAMRNLGARTPMFLSTMMMGVLFYLLPAAGFFVCAYYVKRRRSWAVIVSLVLASLGCLFGLVTLIAGAVMMSQQPWHPAMLIPIVLAALIVAAFGQLIYHLARSFEAIQYSPPDERGFEPIMAAPVSPAPDPHEPPIR